MPLNALGVEFTTSAPWTGTCYVDSIGWPGSGPAAAAPSVSTGLASAVASSAATLNGTVNPNGASTSCYFEYGTSASYGSITASQPTGSGTASVGVSASLSGLIASTTYHFRLNCSNSVGPSSGADASFATSSPSSGPLIKKVFYVMEENRNANQVYGASDPPYINNTLVKTYDWVSNYTDVAHPSEPNYVWLEAGDAMNLWTDADPSPSNSTNTTDHLVNYLGPVGKTWKSYQENLPGSCGIYSSGSYAAKHNPFVFFQDVVGSYLSPSAYCLSHIVDLSVLSQDFAANTLADFIEITPNSCNDGHDCTNPAVEAFLQSALIQQIFTYVLNPANNAVLIINWDEGEGQNIHPMLLIAPPATLSGAHQITTRVDHSSFVRWIQIVFGVDPSHNDPTTGKPFSWLRGASTATDFSSFFAPPTASPRRAPHPSRQVRPPPSPLRRRDAQRALALPAEGPMAREITSDGSLP
jgi:hypothetical protein